MKLTTKQLKQIIAEELRGVLMEVKYGRDDTPYEYSLWNGTDHVPYPMGPPKGLPDDFMFKLQQLAIDDPSYASELTAGLPLDDEKAEEISEYLYDVAIAHLTKNSILSAVIDAPNNEIVVFTEQNDWDGDLYYVEAFPMTTPRSEVYEYMKEFARS